MRAFVACLALAATAVNAGYLSGGAGGAGVGYSSGYSTGYAAPVATSYGGGYGGYSGGYGGGYGGVVSSGPAFVSAAPAVVAAAPVTVANVPAPPAPGTVGAPQVFASGVGGVRVHEVHTHSGGNQVRVEEYRGPRQVVRVLEGGQAAPEVLRVQGPAQPGSVVRLVTRGGNTHVQHVVHQDPSVQVVNVQKQPAPGPRVVQIVRQPAPPARVEVAHQAPAAPGQVVLQAPPAGETHVVGPSPASNVAAVGFAAPAVGFAAPSVGFAGSSFGGAVYSAPVAAAPVVSSVAAAPVSYSSGFSSYDGGYSQGGHVKVLKKYH